MISPVDHYIKLAKAYHSLDLSEVELLLEDNIKFECQYFKEAEPVVGKTKVEESMIQIFLKFKEVKPTMVPELAVMGDQSNSSARFSILKEGDQCLLLVDDKNNKGAVCVAVTNANNKVEEIYICRIVQTMTAIVGSGIYPK